AARVAPRHDHPLAPRGCARRLPSPRSCLRLAFPCACRVRREPPAPDKPGFQAIDRYQRDEQRDTSGIAPLLSGVWRDGWLPVTEEQAKDENDADDRPPGQCLMPALLDTCTTFGRRQYEEVA